MSQEHVREWFDDLVEAQFWLKSLISCCGNEQLARLREAAAALDETVATIVGRGLRGTPPSALDLQTVIQTVSECARADGRVMNGLR
ncbi:hypothetical protein ACWCQN_38650 [Streptomyces sp. NPDC001984]